MEEIEKAFKEYIVRVLVEVSHYIIDEDGNMLLTHIDTIETDSNSLSNMHSFRSKNKSITLKAKEIRLYRNTKSPIHLEYTIKLTNNF